DATVTGVQTCALPILDRQGPRGWDAIRRQERFLAALGDARVALLPGGGCPGPRVVDLAGGVRLVALDTEWWLHDGRKPANPTSEIGRAACRDSRRRRG